MELYTTLRPLLIFSNICGLGPYGVYRDGTLQHEQKSLFWSFMVVGLLCGMPLMVFLDFSGTTRLADSRIADMIDTYGFMLTCLGGIAVHLALSKELLSLWNRVMKMHPKTPATATHALIDIFGCLAYEITFAVISIWIAPMEYLNFFYYVLETLTYVALEVTNFVIFMQFYHLVLVCWRSFNALSSKLRKLLARVHCQPRHERTRARLLLKKLSAEHAEIVSVCRMINKVFAVQNLLSVALIFIELTYALYSGIFSWLDDLSASAITDTFLWAGYFLYKLMIMLTVCSLAKSASNDTEKLLRKFAMDDAAFLTEVENFTLQLLHADSQFDAHGFFPLDFTLIYSVSVLRNYVTYMQILVKYWLQMISSVAGYLVILIQFSKFNLRHDWNVTTNETGKK